MVERDGAGASSFALVAAVLYASSVLMQKVTLRSIDALRATWLGCLVGTVVTLPFAGELVREAQAAPISALLGAAYLGAFPTAVAFTTWAYALRRMPAGRLGPLGYLVTVLSVLMSWAFLPRCRPCPPSSAGRSAWSASSSAAGARAHATRGDAAVPRRSGRLGVGPGQREAVDGLVHHARAHDR